jgi:hypothetical protein
MKTLFILAFGLLIINNVYASGLYGNLYDSSDLLTTEGQFKQERKEKSSINDEAKKRRSNHQSKQQQQQQVGPDEEELKKLHR